MNRFASFIAICCLMFVGTAAFGQSWTLNKKAQYYVSISASENGEQGAWFDITTDADKQGGGYMNSVRVYKQGAFITLTPATFSPTGKAFMGWQVSSDDPWFRFNEFDGRRTITLLANANYQCVADYWGEPFQLSPEPVGPDLKPLGGIGLKYKKGRIVGKVAIANIGTVSTPPCHIEYSTMRVDTIEAMSEIGFGKLPALRPGQKKFVRVNIKINPDRIIDERSVLSVWVDSSDIIPESDDWENNGVTIPNLVVM